MLQKLMVGYCRISIFLAVHLLNKYISHYCLFFLSGGFSVFAGVGERTREGNDLYREMIESGVIKLGEKQVSNPASLNLDSLFYLV